MRRTYGFQPNVSIICVAVVILFSMAPTATADHIPWGSESGQNGDLSRALPFVAAIQVYFKDNGFGWYDPDNINDYCNAHLLGVRASLGGKSVGRVEGGGIGGPFDYTVPWDGTEPHGSPGSSWPPERAWYPYYESGRVTINLWKHTFEDSGLDSIDTPFCIDPTAPPADYHIVYPGMHIYSGYFIPQDAILCVYNPFDICIAQDWDWDLYACKQGNTSFGPTNQQYSTFFQV